MSRQNQLSPQVIHRAALRARHAVALAALLICIWGAIASARAGLSRLLSEYGSAADSLESTKRALDFNSADPEAHYTYAVALAEADRGDDAALEFERAVSLRPEDYFLWQELGRAREDSGDSDGAVAALRRAIKLAPDYSQPHWQLGNLLLRRNELVPAFTEMRAAAASDPELFAMMADLAWGAYDGDVQSVLAATQPQTDTERISLARFLVDHNRIEAALNTLRATAKIASEDQRALVGALIAAGEFQAARQVWLTGVSAGDVHENDLFDGGFEGSMSSDEQGFGWQPTRATQTVHILLDPNEPRSGKRSLQLEYTGNFDPATPVISQLVLVAARTRYRLSFSARTENLTSGGLPVVVVREITGDRRVIGQSTSLSTGTHGWREFSIEFETTDATNVVTISIQRQPCSSNPCPIVGRVWFDSFSLKRLS